MNVLRVKDKAVAVRLRESVWVTESVEDVLPVPEAETDGETENVRVVEAETVSEARTDCDRDWVGDWVGVPVQVGLRLGDGDRETVREWAREGDQDSDFEAVVVQDRVGVGPEGEAVVVPLQTAESVPVAVAEVDGEGLRVGVALRVAGPMPEKVRVGVREPVGGEGVSVWLPLSVRAAWAEDEAEGVWEERVRLTVGGVWLGVGV